MPGPFVFVNDELHKGEYTHRYYPGGLHPVHIDDRSHGYKNEIVHKLLATALPQPCGYVACYTTLPMLK